VKVELLNSSPKMPRRENTALPSRVIRKVPVLSFSIIGCGKFFGDMNPWTASE
jgi:hypothetical protein